MIAALLITLTSGLLQGGVTLGSDTDPLLSEANELRADLAGWMRGTEACAGGRVARRLASLLRDRGVTAEFHPAGEGGGFTVASLGPEVAPVSAILVASVCSCPEPPDNQDLQYGAPARPLWRAAAIAATLVHLSRAPRRSGRVRALFLGGDGHASLGHQFVDLAAPNLSSQGLVLDAGGLLVTGSDRTRIIVGHARRATVSLWLHVPEQVPRPGDRLDRALAVVEHLEIPVPPSAELHATVCALEPDACAEVWPLASAPVSIADLRDRLSSDGVARRHLTNRCTLEPREDRGTAKVRCGLNPGQTVGRLAAHLMSRLSDPSVIVAWNRREPPREVGQLSPPLLRTLHNAVRQAWSTPVQIRAGTELGSGHDAPGSGFRGSLGLPLMPTHSHPAVDDPLLFARGVRLTQALLSELTAGPFDPSHSADYPR